MKFIQIHELIAYPASNLNRDDMNRPKTVRIGDTTRLRISSQSLKRAWRVSTPMRTEFAGSLGIRTNVMAAKIEEALINGQTLPDALTNNSRCTRNKVSVEVAKKMGLEIDRFLRNKDGKESKKEKAAKEQNDGETDSEPVKTAIMLYSASELQAVDKVMSDVAASNAEVNVGDYDFATGNSVDIAMFGRMVANNPSKDVEAAVQVAHAFTVNKTTIEEDYFTAVDDINIADNVRGAGHLDITEFGAGLFYLYLCIDYELLVKNLNSEALAQHAVKTLIDVAATVSPTGKQNSFASRAYASYILVEQGSVQPRSLASAFFKPVTGNDLIGDAITALRTARDSMDRAYGKCYDSCYEVDVPGNKGSLAELEKFLR